MPEIMLSGRRFSYRDGGPPDAPPLLALHGHFGSAAMWRPLAEALGASRRVLALDQRGHGGTALLQRADGAPADFSRAAFAADAAAFVEALGLGPVDVLGHSMGGVTAFQLAARRPDLVRSVVDEEGGALNAAPAVAHPVLDVSGWTVRARSRSELSAGLGLPPRLEAYFMESCVPDPDGGGVRLAWDPAELMASQEALVGSWWADWEAVRCPVLLLHGTESGVLPTAVVREMAARLPSARFRGFPGAGHWLHDDDPAGFAAAVAGFLAERG